MDTQGIDMELHARKRLQNDYNQHFVDTGERPQNFIREYRN